MKKRFTLIFSLLVWMYSTTWAQVPKLNSYPLASATIFLDFDGHTVNTLYWNGGVPFYATPYNFTAEQITTMFNMVAEDFRPFNLNITTDSTVYFAAPINRRQRIVITTNSSWYGSAGGVAYLGSFTWGLEVPGFVFSNLLSNNIKYVAEAISHETGHTLNLQHQSKYDAACNFLKEYNDGAGTGEIGWAPIMGVGYYKNLTLWHRGSSSLGCSSIQDDIAVIAGTRNGFGFRSDDVGNDLLTAQNIVTQSEVFSVTGFINNSSDVDIYKFEMSQNGKFALNANPFNVNSNTREAANIDLKVELLQNNGVMIAAINPGTALNASLDTQLNAGTYYVRVSNVSNINTTNYGMLGLYMMNGTISGGSTSSGGNSLIGTTTVSPTTATLNLSLMGTASGSTHTLSWNISTNETLTSLSIEISKDGVSFQKLADVSTTATSYVNNYSSKGTAYYRLNARSTTLQRYSNVVALSSSSGSGSNTKPSRGGSKLRSATVYHEAVIESGSQQQWRLLDMNGKLISTGTLSKGFNRLDMHHLTHGIYLLQILDAATIETHKIVKY